MLHAANARCPASPLRSHSNDAATVRSSSVSVTGASPYQLLEIVGRPGERLVEMARVAGIRSARLDAFGDAGTADAMAPQRSQQAVRRIGHVAVVAGAAGGVRSRAWYVAGTFAADRRVALQAGADCRPFPASTWCVSAHAATDRGSSWPSCASCGTKSSVSVLAVGGVDEARRVDEPVVLPSRHPNMLRPARTSRPRTPDTLGACARIVGASMFLEGWTTKRVFGKVVVPGETERHSMLARRSAASS